MMKTAMRAPIQFPIVHVGQADTQILDYWHRRLFLCQESNRLGHLHYIIRHILGDHDPKVLEPWDSEDEARRKFAALNQSARMCNAFVEIEGQPEELFDSVYAVKL